MLYLISQPGRNKKQEISQQVKVSASTSQILILQVRKTLKSRKQHHLKQQAQASIYIYIFDFLMCLHEKKFLF